MKQFDSVADAQRLALAIVDTLPEPFLVLDHDLRIVAGSRCFYEHFKLDPASTRGSLLYAIGDGAWDIPALRLLLETMIPQHTAMSGFEVVHDFPNLGTRTMLLNARIVHYDVETTPTILLAFQDITDRRVIEREKEHLLDHTRELLAQQKMLLSEMQHRVANSLQIIASILLLKARAVSSEETREQLNDAHQRVMSVAAVQRHLTAAEGVDRIDVASYLRKLCDSLGGSMIGEGQPIEIVVAAGEGSIESSKAVSIGLIVTELLINAVKYAFPRPREGAKIQVIYKTEGSDWSLVVSDNGIGKLSPTPTVGGGLGTAIVGALSKQLDARVLTSQSASGLRVEIVHGAMGADLATAA